MQYGAQNDNQKTALDAEASEAVSAPNTLRVSKLAALRATVAAIEHQGKLPHLPDLMDEAEDATPKAPMGAVSLPGASLHEIWAQKPQDHAAASGLLLAALKENDAPFLWVTSRMFAREYGLPYGPGLKAVGIDPSRLLLVQCLCQQDVLWTLEEGLKSSSLSAVVGEVGPMELNASRRLLLMAREHNSRALLLMRAETMPSTAAYSRWRAASTPSHADMFDARAPGQTLIEAQLVKHRGGKRPIKHTVEHSHATDHLPLVTPMANRFATETPSGRRAVG